MKITLNKSTRNDKPDHYLMIMTGKWIVSIYLFNWIYYGYSKTGDALALDFGPLSIRRFN